MKVLAGVLTFILKPLDVEEFVWYIVTDLDMEYNPIVSEVLAHVEPISIGELYSNYLATSNILILVQWRFPFIHKFFIAWWHSWRQLFFPWW